MENLNPYLPANHQSIDDLKDYENEDYEPDWDLIAKERDLDFDENA